MTPGPRYQDFAYVGLGSNMGDPVEQVNRAIERLDHIVGTKVIACSSLYRSAPLGSVKQPEYINAVVSLRTRLAARALFTNLQEIERLQGRRRAVRWGPRTLDLDFLVFGDLQIDEADLTLPHPGIALRNFVLLPLREIAPKLVIPGLGPVTQIVVDEDEPRIARIA